MRTDKELQQDVLTALDWEPGVHAEHIGVTIDAGVVTLQGTIGTLREKYLAEQTARNIRDVRAVANDLTVAPDRSTTRSDTEIAAAVANAIEWDSALNGTAVKAVVRNGWVTLEGSVGWAYQRDAAERAVRNLTGIRGISNAIAIHPAVDAPRVKSSIADTFQRNARFDADRVHVETHGGTVTLTGTVRSLAELDAAVTAAWTAPGVTQVNERLVVMP